MKNLSLGNITVNLSIKARRRVTVADSAGATIRRITPLGFTEQEAVGWYRNHLQSNWRLKFALASVSGFALVIFGAVFLNAYFESSLTSSMIMRPFVYVTVGSLFAYAANTVSCSGFSVKLSIIHESISRRTSQIDRYGILSFVLAGLMIYFWVLPSSIDAAPSNGMIRFMMYLTFICAGVLVLTGITLVSHHLLIILSIAVGKMLGLLGAYLILSPAYLYGAYPAPQQADAGVIMITIMTIIDMILLPCWLCSYFRTGAPIRQS